MFRFDLEDAICCRSCSMFRRKYHLFFGTFGPGQILKRVDSKLVGRIHESLGVIDKIKLINFTTKME